MHLSLCVSFLMYFKGFASVMTVWCSCFSVCCVFTIMYAYMYSRQHRGEVVGLAFSPDGEFMYSADSQGFLALYNASEEDHNIIRVVCMYTCAKN